MFVNYEYYRVFYYVAKYGSLTKAAEALLSNQPNLTRAVKNLEAELGCPLFSRSNRGMILTPEGETLYRHIRAAFAQIEAGEAAVTQSRELRNGSVFLAASEVALRSLLLPVLKQFRTRYPGIHLRISNYSTPQAVAALRETTADFAVVTAPVGPTPSLVQTPVRPIQEIVICPRDCSPLLEGPVALKQLDRYPLITLGSGTASYSLYSSFFAANGAAFHPDIEAATADQIIPMVEMGLGIGIVPRAFLRPSDNVCPVALTKTLPPRNVCIVKRRGRPLSVAARALETMILKMGDTVKAIPE